VCAGIEDFSLFNASTIDPLTLYVYDSVKMLKTKVGFLTHMRGSVANGSLSREFANKLINDEIQIPPLTTGQVYFDPGILDLDYLFKGDRNSGHIFDILNFNAALDDFVFVGIWEDQDVIMCGTVEESSMRSFARTNCHDVVFRGGTIPSDAPPPIIIPMSSSIKAFLLAIGAITVVCAVIAFGLVIRFQSEKVIRNGQPLGMLFIAFGCILGGIVVVLNALEPSVPLCAAISWLDSLAFVFVFSTILLKMQRVDRIVNNISLKRIKLTNTGLIQSLSVNVIIISVLCMLSNVLGDQKVIYGSTEDHNQVYLKGKCSVEGITAFSYLNLAYNAGIAVACMVYLWKIRNVPSSVNETDSIVNVFVASIFIIVVAIVLVEAVGLDPIYIRLVVGLTFFLLVQISLQNLFLSKFLELFQDYWKSKAIADAKYVKGNKKLGNFEEDNVYLKALEAIGEFESTDEKIKHCYHVINLWKLVIMKVFDDQDDSTTKKNTMSEVGKSKYVVDTENKDDGRASSQVLDTRSKGATPPV
jgi:hypothetical protein